MKRFVLFFLLCFFTLTAMTQNPAAQGFDTANSDAKAIALADDVMKAMGGRKAWDRTRFITWNFFGARKHIWDKKTGNVRIEGLRDQSIAIINVNNDTGMIFRNGEKVSHPDSLTKYIKIAKGQWINDSYWLVMPYKLKDSGVTLKYLGDAKTQKDEEAHLLSLTFKEVGNTPQNKYHVWVTKSDNLVKQWAFFQSAANENPGFVLPWENYQKEGKILLSGDRGERKLTDIKVLKKIEGKVMREF